MSLACVTNKGTQKVNDKKKKKSARRFHLPTTEQNRERQGFRAPRREGSEMSPLRPGANTKNQKACQLFELLIPHYPGV